MAQPTPQVHASIRLSPESEARREADRLKQAIEVHRQQAEALEMYSSQHNRQQLEHQAADLRAEEARLKDQIHLDKAELSALCALLKLLRATPLQRRPDVVAEHIRTLQAKGMFTGERVKPLNSLMTIHTINAQVEREQLADKPR